MQDMLIVGAGPAGCSAALTARARNLSVQIAYSGEGALEKAPRVDNYPGMPGVSGAEMLSRFREQAREAGATLSRAIVQRILPSGEGFTVLAGNDIVEARCVLLCSGAARVRSFEGEERLLGAGVSYCATCDGMLYQGKTVALIMEGEHKDEEEFLRSVCNVQTFPGEKPKVILGDAHVRALLTDKGEHPVDAVFILRPAIALTQLLPELETDKGAVHIDADGMTSVPGVFAAGDIAGAPLQVAKAVGDGNRAALAAAKWLRAIK